MAESFFSDELFQDALTALLCRDTKALHDCAALLDPNDFKPVKGMRWGRPRWIIAERALEHYQKHHEPIGTLLGADVLEYANGLNLGEPQLTGDLMGKHLDAIPDPANAIRAQMTEIPAQLGRTDPGRRCQLLGRDGGHTTLGEVAQSAQVLRQSSNGGIGYLLTRRGVGDHEVTDSSQG